MGLFDFLSKERTIAGPGFNRWLVPPAALAIHLCIGMAYGFSVFWLPLSKAIGIKESVACARRPGLHGPDLLDHLRLEDFDAGVDVHAVLRLPGPGRLAVRRLARARRSAQGRYRRGGLLVRRPGHLGAGRLHPPDLADVDRFRRHRRHRPGPRLYFARLDPDQMVPGPPRHGDRHGHHGLRRRRRDRRPAGRQADEALRHGELGRRLGNLPGPGRDLLRLHGLRRADLPRARHRLEAGRLDPAGQIVQRDDHLEARACQPRLGHSRSSG